MPFEVDPSLLKAPDPFSSPQPHLDTLLVNLPGNTWLITEGVIVELVSLGAAGCHHLDRFGNLVLQVGKV